MTYITRKRKKPKYSLDAQIKAKFATKKEAENFREELQKAWRKAEPIGHMHTSVYYKNKKKKEAKKKK